MTDHGLSRPCRELRLLSESLAICIGLALDPKPLYRTAEDEVQIEGGNKYCNWATVFARSPPSMTTRSMLRSLQAEKRDLSKNKPWKCRGMESHEAGSPPFPHHLEIHAGFPHSHGYGDGYHVSENQQSPAKIRNQRDSHRKGLVNHVPGLKREGCPGTLKILVGHLSVFEDGQVILANASLLRIRIGFVGTGGGVPGEHLNCETAWTLQRHGYTSFSNSYFCVSKLFIVNNVLDVAHFLVLCPEVTGEAVLRDNFCRDAFDHCDAG